MNHRGPSVRIDGLPEAMDSRAFADVDVLESIVNRYADELGTGRMERLRGPLIATGHQAYLYHPGILAKDLLLREARESGASVLHVVVDQDAHDVWGVDLPEVRGDRLTVRHVRLARDEPTLATGVRDAVRPSVDAAAPLLKTPESLPGDSVAQQMTAWLARLRWGGDNPLPVLFVSDLDALPTYWQLVRELVDDAPAAVRAYNKACMAHPEAGMSLLAESAELVEVPLWAVRYGEPRQRVFVDVADRQHQMVLADGTPLGDDASVWPRALMLTAYLRASLVSLFVHGTGGHVYDRITERWWRAWRGETLAPEAMVTADAYLDFPTPVNDTKDLRDAVWWRHHLPHNLDRHVDGVDPDLASEKRGLLSAMPAMDRSGRRQAFERLHRINDRLAATHADELRDADRRLERTRVGISNREIARRRDWFFGLYPDAQLEGIADELRVDAQRLLGVGSRV
ncbi:hypothetical protein Pan265_09870 [Mucisphaera calidilacus]|uniref:Uncharacterized protein n=2 Tax=Mucisphaera calidilacus TaxID=2527982 RepID=A0A518BVY8_9BACT|nr:hypothetical protein Pan265_09870 [Mucisphaera calidilacus]